ncbi:hypothetical protein H4R19_005446, partial [Coemansia spiralis]
MESRYKSIKHIGEGAFSSVILALNIETGEKVAIKKMKKRRWKDTAAQAEIAALQKLNHENIIRLLDVFREDYRSFLVFECMDCDLNELVVSRNGRHLPDTVILDITYQVLSGLDFIHANDLFHRDIKPENVLIRRHIMPGGPGENSSIVVEAKIADFGLVHDMDFSRPLTDYISTRWYRAPEVLLNCTNYSTPIDVWAVGTIVSELATLRPLFPGANQIDQLRRIFEVLGTPRISAPGGYGAQDEPQADAGSWYEGAVHARKLGIAFVPSQRKPLNTVIPDVSHALRQLIDYLLVLNPAVRPTAHDGLMLVSRMLDQHLGEPLSSAEDALVPDDHMVMSANAAVEPEPEALAAPIVPHAPTPPTSGCEPQSPAQLQEVPQPSAPVQAASGAPSGVRLSAMPPPRRVAPLVPIASGEAVVPVSPPADKAQVMTKQVSAAATSDNGGHTGSSSSFVSVAAPGPPPAAATAATAAPAAAQPAAKTTTEVSIVKSLHREPLRDPRADLSDLIVTKGTANGKRASRGGSGGARGFVVPHMRATTPVSTSVPAPQIVMRGGGHGYAGGDNTAGDVTGDEDIEEDYVSIVSSRRESIATRTTARQARRPSRLAVGRDGPRISFLRVRPQSASSLNSVGSANARSIVVSPTVSTQYAGLSPSSLAFSFGDVP